MRVVRALTRALLVVLILVVVSGVGSLAFAVFPYPTGIRLDLGSTPESYVVRWTTDEFGAQFGNDVTYGPVDGSWNRTATGSARTVLVWVDSFRWLRPLRIHEAELDGLEPGVSYRYQVPSDREHGFSVPSNGSIRVVAMGDVGTSGEAARIVSLASDRNPHLAIIAGDLAYAGGDANGWTRWLEMMEPLGSQAPLLPARGNHEVEPPFGSRLFRASFPGRASYYSYDAGPAHFVHLDTEISLSDEAGTRWPGAAAREDAQVRWLRADLASARGRGVGWIVAVFHEPAYSSGRVHGSSPEIQARWGPIFDEHAVDLVIQAHDHNYQRSFPLRNGTVVSTDADAKRGEGTVYLVTGGGGRSVYDRFRTPAPEWSAARAAVHEFLSIDIGRDAIEAQAVGLDGEAVDAFAILAPAR